MHIGSLLDRAVRLWPDREAVVCGDRRWSYAAFCRDSRALAAGLLAAGLRPGDRVAIHAPNSAEFLQAYFAAAYAGVILCPLNTRLAERELAAILASAGAKLVLTLDPVAAVAGIAARTCDDVRAGHEPLTAALPPGDDAVAHLYYTSGTTGRPKGVMLTHRNVVSHALGAIAELHLSDADVWAHVAPLFHLADAWATFAVTAVGGRHVVVPRFEPAVVIDAFRGHGVTLTNLVPTMLNALVHHPGVGDAPYPALRYLMSGGAPIAPRLVQRIMRVFGCEYVQTYGMTETSPYLTLSLLKHHLRGLPAEQRFDYLSRTGREFITVDLRVVDERGQDVPRDDATVGEIRVRGDSVTPGYWNDPDATAAAFEDGWLKTGDLAVGDAEGYVDIVDRAKDMIVTGGENVYSTEVEYALAEHPAVLESAVIGAQDEHWGEVVVAVVALVDGGQATAEELIAFCKQRLARYKAPKRVEFVTALPKTGSGKITKTPLRGRFAR